MKLTGSKFKKHSLWALPCIYMGVLLLFLIWHGNAMNHRDRGDDKKN